jgi:hypothetical protein
MSPFHQVDVLHEGRIVCVRRSARRFEGAQELKLERSLLVEKLNSIGRAGRGLLIDSRSAPHSTDDNLQEEFRRFRVDVSRGFARVATVVRTKVAILQVNRLCADQAQTVQPFDDEAAAISYLLSQLPAAPAPR